MGSEFNISREYLVCKKALRYISFRRQDCNSSPLFFKLNSVKFEVKILLENVLLVSKYINNPLSQVFDKRFTFCSNIHNCETVPSTAGKLSKLSFRTKFYGKTSITASATNSWNKAQTAFSDATLKNLTSNKFKVLLSKKCFENY